MKKRLVCLLLACVLLTGCTAQPVDVPASTVSAPQQKTSLWSAPIGDAGLSYTATAALWLPTTDGQQLQPIYDESLTFTYSLHPAETILRALLTHPGNGDVSPLAGGTLTLVGKNPVEVSGGVATVNLSAAAAELPRQELYTICLAITATLCELSDVDYVNILVDGQAIAMDESGYLPLGAIRHQGGQELPLLYEQLMARRVPEGTLPTAVPLTSAATLYFPLADCSGIVPQIRRISFAGQHPQQLVQGLLEALSAGAEDLSGVSALPKLTSLLTAAPEITMLPDGSLRVTLRFTGDLRSWLTTAGADPACTFAAIVYTLTTFIPHVSEVCLFTGDRGVTQLATPARGSLLFSDALHHRSDYAAFLMAQCTVYAAAAQDGMLTAQTATLPYRSVFSPRALLLILPAAPQDGAILPASIADSDILGMAVADDTLLINLSARYADVLRAAPDSQRLAVCAIVNTLCQGLNVKRVRFFFDSAPTDSLGSDVLWSGEFFFTPGLIR